MSDPKRWQDLGLRRKVSGILLAVLQVGLLVAALADIRWRSAEHIRGRKLWWAMAAFVNYIGPISYFLFGRK